MNFLQDYLIKTLLNARARYLILYTLIVVFAYQLSILLWALYPVPVTQFNNAQNTAIATNLPANQQPSLIDQSEVIKKAFLFGKAEAVKAAPTKVVVAPQTLLKYKLRGIYHSQTSSQSSAIIEIKPNNSKTYRIDDALADNIILAAVETDHVLINRYGKLERLNLEKPLTTGVSLARATDIPNPTSFANTDLLRSYRQTYASNPMALAQRFQSIPVQQNGKHIGFRLKGIKGEQLLGKLDFKESDIFTKINGIGLDKPFQALEALKSLTTAKTVAITVIRNGNEETLDFSL